MNKFKFSMVAASMLAAVLASSNAHAGDDNSKASPALLKGGIGLFDANKRDNTAVEFRLEYMGDRFYKLVRPIGGISATSDGATYGFVGVALDVPLGDGFYVTPSFAPGLFSKGSGKDLGHGLQFRTQVEVGYEFQDESRLSGAVSHRSNASLGDKNPGEETISVYYSTPFHKFF